MSISFLLLHSMERFLTSLNETLGPFVIVSKEWRPTQTTHKYVSFYQSKIFYSQIIVFHWRLTIRLASNSSNISYLFYKKRRKQQIQAVVKLYGVFAFIWKNLDYAPNKLVSPYSRRGQYDPRWTFMQAAN